jgi:hypothetical protein
MTLQGINGSHRHAREMGTIASTLQGGHVQWSGTEGEDMGDAEVVGLVHGWG